MVMRAVPLAALCLFAAAFPPGPAGAEEDLPPLSQIATAERPGWMVDRRMGCWLWNPDPRPGETVSWTGDCGADGRAFGHGVREWRSPRVGTGRYAGEMREGREEGRGAWTGPDGETYVGDYQYGRFHGRGTLTRPDGSRYEGEFRDGAFHGLGRLVEADGRQIEGEWRRGRLDGPARIVWPDGRMVEAAFAKGRRVSPPAADTPPRGNFVD